MGKDEMNHELDESQVPQLGADHAANAGLRGEFRITPNVPPEHRIPPDQLPEPLRKKFPEGMPIQSGRALDPDNDAFLQALKKLIEEGDLERVMQVLAEKAGKEPGKDMAAIAEMFGAQREVFRKRYLELQRPDLSPEQQAELLKLPAQMVGEVATTNDKGESLPLFDREKMKTEKEMKLMVTRYKIQVEMQLAMAAFGSGLNYEDQTYFRVGQMNPEGSAMHDSPIYKLFQFVSAAAPAEANLDAEQFAQLAAVDRREAFAGTQARFYIWVRGESGKEYQGFVPLSAFMDKVDAPEWYRELLVQNWADERVVQRPGEEIVPEGWTKPKHSEGYLESIGGPDGLINELLLEKLEIPKGEKILSTNLWHPLMSTRIDAKRLHRDDVRGEVIDNLFSHFLASFTLLRMFGRDRAWDKTLSGRVIDAFRKGLSPQIYYEQLYGLPPEGRGPIFLLTMYWDIWGEKLDKFFPWDRINFNSLEDSRSLAEVKQEVGSMWYQGWSRYDSVADIQRKIIETKLRREGVAASEVWRESLMVMGLATRDAKAAVATYEKMLKPPENKHKLDPAKRKILVKRFSQYVAKLNETNPYGFEAYRKMAGIGATDTGYRAWIADQMTEAVYNPRIAMARPGEMRSPAEMGDFHWTRAEEIALRDADFEGVFYQWGKSKEWIDRKKASDKDAFKGRRGAQRVLEHMSYDNFDPQKMKDSDPKKWHDYINNAAKTSNSMIGVTEVAVAKESIRDILEKGVVQGQFLNDEAVRDTFDRYFVNQFKEAFGEMKKTFNYFPREFKAHVGKEIILCLARLACKLKDNQWYTMMHRSSSGDGAGWGEVNLDQRFFLDDQGELNEDGKLLQRLGLQFQGKSVYQRNGYPVSWQVQPSHMAILAGVEKVNFLTPMQSQYGGRVLGREVFVKLARDVIGDQLFADAADVQALVKELEEITDDNPGFKYTQMTQAEIEMMKNAAAQYAPVFTGVGKFIQGRK